MAELAFLAFSEGNKEYPKEFLPDRTARRTFRLLIKGDTDALSDYEKWKEAPKEEPPSPKADEQRAPEPEGNDDDRILEGIQRVGAWAQSQHHLVNLWHKEELKVVDAKAAERHRQINASAAEQQFALFPPDVAEAALHNFGEYTGRGVSFEELLASSAGVFGWAYANLSAEDRDAILGSN